MSHTGTVKWNRILSLLLIAAMLFTCAFGMTACVGSGGNDEGGAGSKDVNSADAGRIVSETDTELTVIDQAGREVTVSKDIDSIALCWRVVIRFLLNLGQGDKITGIGKSEPFLEALQPSLAECVDVGKGVADIEALAELEPDLFVHKSNDVETLEAIQKVGIPAIGINVETPEDMVVAIDLLGKVCGAQDKAAALIEFYEREMKHCEELTSAFPEDEQRTAIVMGSSIGKVADGSMLQGMMLERAGATNCAADMMATELWPTAGTEQIFKWNPDYIFVTGSESALYTPEDICGDATWSELAAVKNNHVYRMPADADSWEFPGIVSVLGVEYMINTMYPELLSDAELETAVDEFYNLSYGRTFTRDELGY